MHPFITAYLLYRHYRETGILWFDVREEYHDLVQHNLLWMDELKANSLLPHSSNEQALSVLKYVA